MRDDCVRKCRQSGDCEWLSVGEVIDIEFLQFVLGNRVARQSIVVRLLVIAVGLTPTVYYFSGRPTAFPPGGVRPSSPELILPTPGAEGAPVSPELVWRSVSSADYYSVQVSEDAAFTKVIFSKQQVDATTVTVTPALKEAKQYWWRVRAVNSAGAGEWAGAVIFSTARTQGIAIRSLTFGVSMDSSMTVASPSTRFGPDTPEVCASVEVSRARKGAELRVTLEYAGQTLNSVRFTYPDDRSNTHRLGWRISKPVGGWRSGTYAVTAFVDGERAVTGAFAVTSPPAPAPPELAPKPAAPRIDSPSFGATGVSTTPSLRWSRPSGATSYDIQVARDDDFADIVFRRSGITSTGVDVAPPLDAGGFWWRVRANGEGGLGPWSQSSYFTTRTAITVTDVRIGLGISDGRVVDPRSVFTPETEEICVSFTVHNAPVGTDVSTRISRPGPQPMGFGAYEFARKQGDSNLWYVSFRFRRPGADWPSGTCRIEIQTQGTTVATANIEVPAGTGITVATAAPEILRPTPDAGPQPVCPTLTWSKAERATSYTLQVALDPMFSSVVFAQSELTGVSIRVTPPLRSRTKFWWRVRAAGPGGGSNWSRTGDFTTESNPVTPSVRSIVTGASLDSKVNMPGSTFRQNAPVIAVSVEVVNAPKGTVISVEWVHVLTGQTLRRDNVTREVDSPVCNVGSQHPKPVHGWMTGQYRVTVSINGVQAGSTTFSVVP